MEMSVQGGAKPHHGTRVDSADPRGVAPGAARHSAIQPAPSPKKLSPGTQCLLFGPPPAGSRSDLCGKGGAQTMLVLRPCCWPGINPVLGEAQPPNPRLRQKEEPIQRVCEIRSGSDPTWTLTARSFLQDQSIEMATFALSQSDHQTGPPGPEWERNVGQGLKPDAKRRHGAWGAVGMRRGGQVPRLGRRPERRTQKLAERWPVWYPKKRRRRPSLVRT